MKSMTGYGYSESNILDGINIKTEIRTLNRKQLDIKLSLPKELQKEEIEIRRLISSSISRGSVYTKIDIVLGEAYLTKSVNVNQKLAAAYLEKVDAMQVALNLPGKFEIKDMLMLPNVVEEVEPEVVSEDLVVELFQCLEKTLLELNNSREKEGGFLLKDILGRISLMEQLISDIEPMAKKLPEYYKEKLQKRLEKENLPDFDDDRLLREIVIFSDKCDVSEEVTRLKSHLVQFKKLLKDENKSVGRNLEFITQEIQREINTLGVKAASTEISPKVVQFKTEAEKVREQIQNVE